MEMRKKMLKEGGVGNMGDRCTPRRIVYLLAQLVRPKTFVTSGN